MTVALRKKRNKGFTMIEVIIVIAIIAIISALAVPNFTGMMNRAKEAQANADAAALANAINIHNATATVAASKITQSDLATLDISKLPANLKPSLAADDDVVAANVEIVDGLCKVKATIDYDDY